MATIEHVVVLMLENRSFDCMLGFLYPSDASFRGLTLGEYNNYNGTSYGVWNDVGMSSSTATIPDPDPGELFVDMNMQLFGVGGRPQTPPIMSGFVQSYATQRGKGVYAPATVMHYFTPEQVPIISTLARAFGVCDQWHASAPCQTWPNRFFTHAATCLGHVDNHDFSIPFPAPSIFGRLQEAGASWRVYFHDMPQSILLRDVWLHAVTHYRGFSQFLADAHAGTLPNYSFIEPRYFADLFGSFIPNDEHPPHNVVYGEMLIATVYNALRSSVCWRNTLLIITYDEHGGCYDHIPPPRAVKPDGIIANSWGFDFSAYGVRVPAVIVSPWIPPGSRIRNPPGGDGSGTPFDHTSIIKTLREVFLKGGGHLTARDDAAPSLMSALSLPDANNMGPLSVDASMVQPTPSQVVVRANAAPNGMQASLAAASHNLPDSAPTSEADLPAVPTPLEAASYPTVATAASTAIARTGSFLGVYGAE
jgi:phospholipase C